MALLAARVAPLTAMSPKMVERKVISDVVMNIAKIKIPANEVAIFHHLLNTRSAMTPFGVEIRMV
jgi:hypothetical protein